MIGVARMRVFAVWAAILLAPVTAVAQWRTEVHSFQSLTIADRDLLTGRLQSGRETTVSGVLSIPLAAEGRLPAVILLHGAAGVLPYVTEWQQELASVGVAAFYIDSFTPRGITSALADQDQLARLNATVDAYRALALLAKHPRIDPNRIVLMGFSRGADAALYASMKRIARVLAPDGARFAAHVALYPNCGTTYIDDTDVERSPIRIFHGTADDYAPIEPCRRYVARLQAAGADAKLTAYEGAQHVFMWSELTEPTVLGKAQTSRKCDLVEVEPGKIVNRGSSVEFTWADPCVERGPTVAYDARAAADVKQAVKRLLGELAR